MKMAKYVSIHVHSSTVHDYQKVEAAHAHAGMYTNRMWSIHTMEYDSTLKKKEILTPATTW